MLDYTFANVFPVAGVRLGRVGGVLFPNHLEVVEHFLVVSIIPCRLRAFVTTNHKITIQHFSSRCTSECGTGNVARCRTKHNRFLKSVLINRGYYGRRVSEVVAAGGKGYCCHCHKE